MALCRLLTTLHDDQGNVAVQGLLSEESGESIDVPEDLAREWCSAIEGLELIGEGSIPSRVWTKPAVAILALDAPPVAEAINQLVPVARAKVSMRIPPGQDTDAALEALKSHLEANVPWGAKLTFLHEEKGDATVLGSDNFATEIWRESFREAYGNEGVETGAGGSIPFIATFKEMFPDAPILVTGASDPTSAYHAPNESQDIGDLGRAALAEAIAFRLLAERAR
jgi:acetylornithine deacetylase/succinyl-diaminopimelate desuccinylase-like protein